MAAEPFPLRDTSSFPEELKAIIELLRERPAPGELTCLHREDGVDWERFAELAVHHRVYPIIVRRLKNCLHANVPPPIMRRLEAQCRNNTIRMLHLSGETERIVHLFRERGIRALVLKGPPLSLDLYGDLSTRPSGDIDLLVQIADMEEAERLLHRFGYIKDDYIRTVLGDWKWRHHHYTFFHPAAGTKVELHWRLNPWPAREPPFHVLWERCRTMTIGGRPIHLLGWEDTFLFLASHGARHGWSRLRWLADIDRLAKRALRWELAAAELQRRQLGHVGGQALQLAAGLLGTPIPAAAQTIAEHPRARRLAADALFYIERKINLHSPPLPPEVSDYHRRHQLNLMPLRQRLLFYLSFLHPYYADCEAVPLPRMLHFLYYPLRPVIWMWRKVKPSAQPGGDSM